MAISFDAPIAPKDTNGAPIASDWDAPEPFDVLDVPAFPVAALPAWLSDWANALAEFAQVPVDMPASIGLAAASLAVARRFHVEVRPGWEEPCNLWIVCAAQPAERKSSIFKHATEAVHDFAANEAERLGPRIRDLEIERHILAGQLESAKAAAVKGKPYEGGDAQQAAREIATKLAELPLIHVPTLVTDDCTAEALAAVLAQNGERLGIFSAEGGPFELMAGRYAERGTNFEMFLKAHSGDHHIVHRIKRDPIFLGKPLLTVAMTVQPSVIAGLHGKEGFRGRGLLARFLYSLPQSLVGRRAVVPVEVPEDIRQRYNAAIRHLLVAGTDDRGLRLTAEADALRCGFQKEIEPRLGPDGDLEVIGDWAGKLTGAVCRIAGVLHVTEHVDAVHALPETIQAVTIARAIEVGRYFLAHATGAFQAMGGGGDRARQARVEVGAPPGPKRVHRTRGLQGGARHRRGARACPRPARRAQPDSPRPEAGSDRRQAGEPALRGVTHREAVVVTFVPSVPLSAESERVTGRLSSLLSPAGRFRREKGRRDLSLSLYGLTPTPNAGRKGQKPIARAIETHRVEQILGAHRGSAAATFRRGRLPRNPWVAITDVETTRGAPWLTCN